MIFEMQVYEFDIFTLKGKEMGVARPFKSFGNYPRILSWEKIF